MSITSENESPASRRISRQRLHSAAKQSSSSHESDGKGAGSRNRSQSTGSSYIAFRRDILYRTINESQLTGSKLNAYVDLLTGLGFDWTPLENDGQTWYLCRGRAAEDQPCRRMIPEVYLRTTIGKVIKAAEKLSLTGDDLVEEVAHALSYAICSEHNPKIHKVVRAMECLPVIEKWRAQQRLAEGRATPIRQERPSLVIEASPTPSPALRKITSSILPRSSVEDRPTTPSSDSESITGGSVASIDALILYEEAEKVKIERHYQEYLRASSRSRERQRKRAESGSTFSSAGMSTDRRWKVLDRLGT